MSYQKREIVLSCLDQIVKSPEFASSSRLPGFLRYIVSETLEGRGERLKAYTIAISVFECAEDFDPQTNSLVRVEAMRLRKRLAAYYAGAGKDDPIEIVINRGTYTPTFEERALQPAKVVDAAKLARPASPLVPAHTPPAALPIPTPIPAIARRNLAERSAMAIALASVAALVAVSWHHLPGVERSTTAITQTSPAIQQPSLALAGINILPESGLPPAIGDSLGSEIISALGKFEFVRVYEESAGSVETTKADYKLIGDINRKGTALQASFRLVHATTGQIVWSRNYATKGLELDDDSRTSMASSISSVLARGTGVILNDHYKRIPPLTEATVGPACVTYGAKYFDSQTLASFRSVRSCLERSIKSDPRNSTYHSALSLLLTDAYRKGFAPEEPDLLFKAALQANEAIALSPQSSEAHISLFVARLAQKRYEDAFESGEKARLLNPYSVEIMSRLGAGYVLRGQCDQGMQLLEEVARIADQGPPWLDFYYFLHAYMSDDLPSTKRYGSRPRLVKTPLGLLAKIVTAHRNGDAAEARHWYNYLHAEFPVFAADIDGSLDRLGLIEDTKAKLISDLKAAGAIRTGSL